MVGKGRYCGRGRRGRRGWVLRGGWRDRGRYTRQGVAAEWRWESGGAIEIATLAEWAGVGWFGGRGLQ